MFPLVAYNPLKLARDQRKNRGDSQTQRQEHPRTGASSGKLDPGQESIGNEGMKWHSQSCPGTTESPVTHFPASPGASVFFFFFFSRCLSHLLSHLTALELISLHFFFLLFFLGPHLRHGEFPRLGVKLELQLPTYTTAHRNTKSLTHWVRPGIEPASPWILVGS